MIVVPLLFWAMDYSMLLRTRVGLILDTTCCRGFERGEELYELIPQWGYLHNYSRKKKLEKTRQCWKCYIRKHLHSRLYRAGEQ